MIYLEFVNTQTKSIRARRGLFFTAIIQFELFDTPLALFWGARE